jgi:hypothetical protein
METIKCPKCGRPLQAEGEAFVDDERFPVFSCPECIMNVSMFGKPVALPLTFCLDAEGRPFDPAAPDGRLSLD